MMRSRPLGRFELRSTTSLREQSAAYVCAWQRQPRLGRGVHDRSQRVSPVSAGDHQKTGRGARAGLKTKDCVFWATGRAPLSYFLPQTIFQEPTPRKPSALCSASIERPLAVHNRRTVQSIDCMVIEGKRGQGIQRTKNLLERNQP